MDQFLGVTVHCQEARNASKSPSVAFHVVQPYQNQGEGEATDASSSNCLKKSGTETGPSNRKSSKSLDEEPFTNREQVHQDNERRIRRAMKEKPREYLLVRNKMERKRMEVNAAHNSRQNLLGRKKELIREEIFQLKNILKRRKLEVRRLKRRIKKLNANKEHDNSIINYEEELELLNLIPETE